MTKKLVKNYHSFRRLKDKKNKLRQFLHDFLPEIVYRSTKIEHPKATRKSILSAIK